MRCSNRWELMQFNYFRRREFITLLGSAAAAWPLAGRAQQPGMRVIGFLSAGSPGDSVDVVDVLRRGLTDAGLIVGYNVAIKFAGPRIKTIDCRRWRPIWFADGSR